MQAGATARVLIGVILLAGLLTGCVEQQPVMVTLLNPFDKAQAEALMQDGPNTISGNGFVRQKYGGVVTCAGNEVSLTPATEYAKERIMAIYGNTERGAAVPNKQFTPHIPEYFEIQRKTRCDAQGNFTFENVADGDFFIITHAAWYVSQYQQDGRALMQRVRVAGGETTRLVLAP